VKQEGYIIKPLDFFLEKQANADNDRAVDVNAPSQAGQCMRHNYYMRKRYDSDGDIGARTQRIFDNGTYTHERLQAYLLEMFLLICDEVPLLDEEYNIQGHTDGFLDLPDDEIAILEIKSINDNQFNQLKDAKEEHKQQGLIYLYCAEQRRLALRKKYKTLKDFYASQEERAEYYRSKYQHMKGGRKFTREQKIQHEVDLNLICDDILYQTDKPITKVIFLYENKNNQELKEYVVERNKVTEHILTGVLNRYEELNEYCEEEEVPPREGTSKSCQTCRWCQYSLECWR
jgi:hypothetical protein